MTTTRHPYRTALEHRDPDRLTAFTNLKPIDAVIVGMYQQLSDQVGENAAIVRQINSRGA